MIRRLVEFAILGCSVIACGGGPSQAHLGDFTLGNGAVIRDCHVGYRTFGRLNDAKSNAVIVSTWMQGTSGDLVREIGPGRLIDSSKYFVIAVDALGNGVSSSPSNSRDQPGGSFPHISIADMVRAAHAVATSHLHINHLRAVVGTSMGGMQAFEWATRYPTSMDKVVAILGSPRSTPGDRRYWEVAMARARATSVMAGAMTELRRASPSGAVRALRFDVDNYVRQAEAIVSHDVSTPFSGSIELATAAVKAKMLIVSTASDDVVDPKPALDFASRVGARIVQIDPRCGHSASGCEERTVWVVVRHFQDE